MKLTALFTLVLGTSLLFQLFYVLPTIQNREVESTKVHQEEITRNIARELDTDLMQTKDRLTELSKRPEFFNMDSVAQQSAITTIAKGSSRFDSLSVMDAKGCFVSSTAHNLSVFTTKSYADRPYFAVPFEQGETYFASPRFYPENDLVGTSVSVPIESDAGERVGVLMGGMRLNEMIENVANYALDEGTIAYLVDKEGTVVAHSGMDLFALEEGPLSLDRSDGFLVQAIMAGEKGRSGEHYHEGTPCYGTYAILAPNGWGVVVETPMDTILAGSSELTRQLLLVNVTLFGIALAVSLVFTQQITAEQRRAEGALEQRVVQLALISDIGGKIAAVLELDILLDRAARLVQESFGHHHVGLFTLDREREDVVMRAKAGSYAAIFRDHRLKLSEGMVGWVARHGQTLLANDVSAESRHINPLPDEKEMVTQSELSVPLRVGGEVVGVLDVQSPQLNAFGENDVMVMETLADQVAVAIENARLFEEVQQRVAELDALRRTSLQLTSSLALPAVLDGITESALTLVGAADCHIYLYDEANETFTFGAALWKDGRREAAVKAPRRAGLTAAVVREGRSVVINDAPHHPFYTTPEAQKWNVQAIAGIPLKQAGQVLGAFTIAFVEPHTFSQAELRVLGLLADQAAVAIENARLVEGLEAEVAARTAEIVSEKEKSETILRNVGDAITMSDVEMRLRYVNPAFTALTGHTTQEAIGQHISFLFGETMSEQDRQSLRLALAQENTWQGEVSSQRKDGRPYEAAIIIAPVRDAKGRLTGYVSSHRDISQSKELERARRQFMTNVSHELRTPMANIKLYTHFARKGLRPEKTGHYLQVLEKQTERLEHLILDILEMTVLDSGQAVIAWEPVSLPTVIRDSITRYQSRAEQTSLSLAAAPVPPDLPMVKGDQARLSQALGELVENAVIFTPAGGQVTVETGTVEAEGQRWVTVAVRDTGPGISPEEQERIFDRFYRGSLAESGHVPGTGLGLSMVQEIVRAHGGRVMVESQVDEGSTFRVWLPSEKK